MDADKFGVVDFEWFVEYSRLSEESLQYLRSMVDHCIIKKKSIKFYSEELIADLLINKDGLIQILFREEKDNARKHREEE